MIQLMVWHLLKTGQYFSKLGFTWTVRGSNIYYVQPILGESILDYFPGGLFDIESVTLCYFSVYKPQ